MNYSIANPCLRVSNIELLERNPRLVAFAGKENGMIGTLCMGVEYYKNMGI